MQDIRTIYENYCANHHSKRDGTQLLNLSPETIRNYLRRSVSGRLFWRLPDELTIMCWIFSKSSSCFLMTSTDWGECPLAVGQKRDDYGAQLHDWDG